MLKTLERTDNVPPCPLCLHTDKTNKKYWKPLMFVNITGVVCARETLIQNIQTSAELRHYRSLLTVVFCDFHLKWISQKLHAEGPPALFIKIYFYLLNLLNLFLDICYDRPDTFSSVWKMLYVTIIVRMENDNLFLYDNKISYQPCYRHIWVYETKWRIETW